MIFSSVVYNFSMLPFRVDEHVHGEGEQVHGFWAETWALITDPAHAATEVFYNLLFDALLIPVAIFIFNKFRDKKRDLRLREQIHREIDAEHGFTGHDNACILDKENRVKDN